MCSGAQRNGMNTRNRRRRKLSITPRAEVRTFALIVCLIVIPVLGIVWGVTATTKPDLSDLVPIQQSDMRFIVLGWSTLLRDEAHSGHTPSPAHTGAQVRALGYMVETTGAVSERQSVRDFVLLPEAGHLFHPAHRFRDQMIAVRLHDRTEVRFSQMALVWAWGTLRVQPAILAGPRLFTRS